MNYWVWPITQENWEILKNRNVWAAKNRGAIDKVQKEDMIIFYIKGTNTFQGIFRVISNWYASKEIIWDDEIKENNTIYPFQVTVEPVILGVTDFFRLVQRLTFVEKKTPPAPQSYINAHVTGPANFGRPIPEKDYKIILEELEKKPESFVAKPPIAPIPRIVEKTTPPLKITHSDMMGMLIELSNLYGFHPESEYQGEPYRYDVTWKRSRIGNPTKVFEVHDKGILDSALVKLKHAYDMWNSRLFLVITEHVNKDKARFLLAGSFHEINHITTILQPQEIKELLEHKKKFREIEEKLK